MCKATTYLSATQRRLFLVVATVLIPRSYASPWNVCLHTQLPHQYNFRPFAVAFFTSLFQQKHYLWFFPCLQNLMSLVTDLIISFVCQAWFQNAS
jgi:hypothetical protein